MDSVVASEFGGLGKPLATLCTEKWLLLAMETLVGLHGVLPGGSPPTLRTREGLLPAVLKQVGF